MNIEIRKLTPDLAEEKMNFIDIIDEIMTIPPNNLIEKIANGECREAKIFVNNFIIKLDPQKKRKGRRERVLL